MSIMQIYYKKLVLTIDNNTYFQSYHHINHKWKLTIPDS